MNVPQQRTWLFENERWKPNAALPVTDRGIRYGMSVFETIGVREGQALFANEHATRLYESATALLGILKNHIPLTLPSLEKTDTGVLRLYITAGDGSPLEPTISSRIFAIFETLHNAALPDEQTAWLYPTPVAPFGDGHKTGNYWQHCEAQRAARNVGFDHALLIDHEDHLLSAAFANVFFVLGDTLYTPPLSLPIRSGVLRSWVMQQHPVCEMLLPRERLDEATEVFITNSRLGVMPLRFQKISSGPLGQKLRQLCQRENLTP